MMNSCEQNCGNKGNRNPEYIKDYGKNPIVVDINRITMENVAYRTALWTANKMQVTLMCIDPGECVGLECHEDVDQILVVVSGKGFVQMGKRKDKLDFEKRVCDGYATMVPMGTWHNLTNVGDKPLKLYSIYAPVEHPRGTVEYR